MNNDKIIQNCTNYLVEKLILEEATVVLGGLRLAGFDLW